MRTEELESLLEGATETAALDFKGPMEWDVKSLVKDFLAMANLQDGGRIVVGLSEDSSSPGGFRRDGVAQSLADTYDRDVMKDQVDNYADPAVDFDVSVVADRARKLFVVIRIYTFSEQPVVCKRDGKDVRAGDIYYRRTRGRPQSCRVDSAHDMRSILLMAHTRIGAYLERLGLRVMNADRAVDAVLDTELEGL